MTRAGRTTKRHRRTTGSVQPTASVIDFLKRRLIGVPDPRSHADFLADMRAGQLANPATSALLDRLERVIS